MARSGTGKQRKRVIAKGEDALIEVRSWRCGRNSLKLLGIDDCSVGFPKRIQKPRLARAHVTPFDALGNLDGHDRQKYGDDA